MQGAPSLSTSSDPVWLLGLQYKSKTATEAALDQEVDRNNACSGVSCQLHLLQHMQLLNTEHALLQTVDAVTADFQSRIWMTYRRGFTPLGNSLCSSVATQYQTTQSQTDEHGYGQAVVLVHMQQHSHTVHIFLPYHLCTTHCCASHSINIAMH